MGKIVKNYSNDSTKARVKKRKRRRDLEQMRRNVHDAKQTLKKKSAPPKATETNFVKTLKEFAPIREKIDNETQGRNKNRKEKTERIICNRLLPDLGLYKKGVKGGEIQKKEKTLPFSKTKQARLADDFLELLQGNSETSNRISRDLYKIVEEWTENSESEGVIKSPVLGKAGGETRKLYAFEEQLSKSSRKTTSKSDSPTTDEPSKVPHKEDKCKRRLFVDVDNDTGCHANVNDLPVEELRFSPRVTHSRYVNDHKTEKKNKEFNLRNKNEVNENKPVEKLTTFTTPQMKLLKNFCINIGEEYLKSLRRNGQIGDPLKEAVRPLKSIFQENRQKELQRRNNMKEFEVQACTPGSASSSFIWDALFPELRPSQQKLHDNDDDDDDNTSNSTVVIPFPRDNGTPLRRGFVNSMKKFELPAQLFNITNERTTSVEVNLNDGSSKTVSIAGNDPPPEDHEDMIVRYLRDCRLRRTYSNMKSVFGELETDEMTDRQNERRKAVARTGDTTVAPFANLQRNGSREKNMYTRNVQLPRKSNLKPPTKKFMQLDERQQSMWVYRAQECSDESQNFLRASTSHNANRDHCRSVTNGKVKFMCPQSKDNKERSTFFPIEEERFGSRQEEVMKQQSCLKRTSSNFQCGPNAISCSQQIGRNPSRIETTVRNEVSADMNSFGHYSNFREPNTSQNYSFLEIPAQRPDSHEKPMVVLLMPPPVHVHCNNVEQVKWPIFPPAIQAPWPQGHSHDTIPGPVIQRSQTIQENGDNMVSTSENTQPIKFVAFEDNKHVCKLPIYMHGAENTVCRKGGSRNHEQRTIYENTAPDVKNYQNLLYEKYVTEDSHHQIENDSMRNNGMKRSFRTAGVDCCRTHGVVFQDDRKESEVTRWKHFPENYVSKQRCCDIHGFEKM